MWKAIGKYLPKAGALFSKTNAVRALAATGVVGVGYHLLNPRAAEPVLPAEIPPTPEMLGAQQAVVDYSAQLDAMAPRMNPAFNQAMPQIDLAGLQRQGMVAGPEQFAAQAR